MKVYLMPETGRFYKANLHCHTTISDGSQTPEQIKADYRAKGYDAVAFTDHEVLIGHENLCDDTFIALHGYEMSVKEDPSKHMGYFQRAYHLNLLARRQDNLTQIFFHPAHCTQGNCGNYLPFVRYKGALCSHEYSVPYINRIVQEASQAGFLVHYNHPRWSPHTAVDYLGLEGIHGVEFYNTGAKDQDHSADAYEDLLRAGRHLVPVAADDNHAIHDRFGGFTMIKAPAFTYNALMDAYAAGNCYASTGPEIHAITAENGRVTVRTSRCAQVLLFSEGRCIRCQKATDSDLQEASFALGNEYGAFFRLEVHDDQGHIAWSRAYFREEWECAL